MGPETDFYNSFVPAWQERVLEAAPEIPYLHMTEIRDPEWCIKHGVSWQQAQEKMDEAAILLSQMGSLYPITMDANMGTFLDAHGKEKVIQNEGDNKASRFLIDHFSFNAYVFGVLAYIHNMHPYAEKVHFMVERKDGVWEKLKQFYAGFGDGLDRIGMPELKKYLGEFIPVGKDRAPVQMADMLCWHASRADRGLLQGRDVLRANTIFHRKGKRVSIPDSIHMELAKGFAEVMNESKDGVSKIRRDNEKTHPGFSRQDKGQVRSGKSRKAKVAEA